jgi:hypothetical protein
MTGVERAGETTREVPMNTFRKIACAIPFLMMGTGFGYAQTSTEQYPSVQPGPGYNDAATGRSSIYDKDGFLRENADGAGGAGSGSDGSGNRGRGPSER